MTRDEIWALVVALECQRTPLSRMMLRLLREMVRMPNRAEWVGEAFEELDKERRGEHLETVRRVGEALRPSLLLVDPNG